MFAVKIGFMLVSFICCYGFRHGVNNLYRGREVVLNRNVAKLINAYVKPLSEKFPNHEVEIQVDIQGPPMRHFGSRVLRRKNPGKGATKKQTKNQKQDAKATTKAKATTASTTTTVKTTTTTRADKNPKKDNPSPISKDTVTKDELKKAIDDLEKKLSKNLSKPVPANNQEPQTVAPSSPGPVTAAGSLQRIIELIKKGVHFQKHAPNTEDSNMEWLQIKIPKTLHNDKRAT